jgi:hypothetical protein
MADTMTIQGKIHELFETQQVTDRFRKREFVVEFADNPMYPQYILFQLVQDKCDLINAFNKGDMINVDFNLRGRSWTSPQGEVKYFNSLEAWRLNPVQVSAPADTGGGSMPPPPKPPEAIDVSDMDDSDDLPF